ncbi:hypothetical protein [Bacillus pinisoli]|uniref:hypothetical protein n=1 Tax=Bacillus pinisoli TaxID=2901866 RepID=UPI001FF61F5E|nr:hypothetical protein [Bacillus pinisoli]
MKNRIIEIEKLRRKCGLLTIVEDNNGLLKLSNRPSSRGCGLYWIYTSYTLEDLCNATISKNKNAIDIPFLAKSRKDLNNVIHPSEEGEFWIVYNGIGGRKPNSNHYYDLGARILQEFRDNQKTGSLKVLGTNLSNLTKWRYSYVELDYSEYEIHKRDIETGWRLENGWPILSKQ